MRALEVSDDEARELTLALEMQVHGLRVELANADLREFKAALRARLEMLEGFAARLASAADKGS